MFSDGLTGGVMAFAQFSPRWVASHHLVLLRGALLCQIVEL